MSDTPLTDNASARELADRLEAQLRNRGITDFRPPPPAPTTCCGRGCNGCVWEGYFEALTWWRDEALGLLRLSVSLTQP